MMKRTLENCSSARSPRGKHMLIEGEDMLSFFSPHPDPHLRFTFGKCMHTFDKDSRPLRVNVPTEKSTSYLFSKCCFFLLPSSFFSRDIPYISFFLSKKKIRNKTAPYIPTYASESWFLYVCCTHMVFKRIQPSRLFSTPSRSSSSSSPSPFPSSSSKITGPVSVRACSF